MPAKNNNANIELTTKNLKFVYRIDKEKTLHLDKAGSLDDQWDSPLTGPVFSSNPYLDGHGPRYLSALSIITADGSNGINLLYKTHSLEKSKPGVEHLTIMMQDRIHPIIVELHMLAYHEEDTIEQWLVLKNEMKTKVEVSRLDSLYFRADAKNGIFLEWYESNEQNTAGFPIREKLNMGIRVLESRDGNRHKAGPIPAFILGFGATPDENKTPCMIAALEWTGSAKFSFNINLKNELEASIGVNQLQASIVETGKSIASPRSIYSFSQSGMGTASRNLHCWSRKHFLPGGDRLRLIDNNSWEGCGLKVSESSIIEMMKDSAELGIELYVLDDGWFGNGLEARVKTNAGLGDWQFNVDRFPNGLDKIMEESKKLGIKFGIWFEPEMVNELSKLYQNHPEWVMRNPGRELARQRNQVTLDVANPEVQEFMYKSVNDILATYPDIRFVKWDCNANINNPYSPYLGADRQGDMLNAYMKGYSSVMRRLIEAHPNVDFQACAAGGGRSNLQAMRYSHTFWPSDSTAPSYRLNAQWNFSSFLPSLTITSHVTHAERDMFQPKFRFDVSMMTQLGMEIDTRTSFSEYLTAARSGIAAYKLVRDIVQQGDLYRHANPADSHTPSLNFVSRDKKRALVLAYQTGELEQATDFVTPISGLNPKRTYKIVEINLPEGDAQARLVPGVKQSQSGAAWMKSGIPLIFTRQWDSAAIVLE